MAVSVVVNVDWLVFKDSLKVQTTVESDQMVRLTVVRDQGTRGRVVISWHLTAAVDVSAVSIRSNNGTVHMLSFYVMQCV